MPPFFPRYLGSEDAETRIRTMRYAQILSGAVYLLFIGLALPLLGDFHDSRDETAIIRFWRLAARTQPSSYKPWMGYALVAAIAIILVWSANFF